MNRKIYYFDISQFFDFEAEASRDSWEALMKLSVDERVRKRKAIKDVTWDRDFEERSPERDMLFRLHFTNNLSDFKEGEALLLHREQYKDGINCTLYKFENDQTIIISVFSLPRDFEDYYDEKLILDKNCVDLRENVFSNFLAEIPYDTVFWDKSLINNNHVPIMENISTYTEELEDTLKNWEINSLTEKQKEAIINSMASKDYYLIQGPPGTGKSFVLGLIILEEILYFKHRVIVIGPNHLAINNVLEQVLKLAPGCLNIIKVGQAYNAPTLKVKYNDKESEIINVPRLNVEFIKSYEDPLLLGLTPHSFYTSRARELDCDTLIIDEAGQMPIPLALMGMIKAKKVILSGDHKQLPPIVVSDKNPERMKTSIFQRLITEDNCTMLDVSFRMCKEICDFVSELFYDGTVKPFHAEGSNLIIDKDPLYDFKHRIILHNIDDKGEQTSDKEAEFIANTTAQFIQRGVKASEIGILSPFRAQAANIRKQLRKNNNISDDNKSQLTSDTVDKMQGQEREVIFFSLTSGNYDYMVEMADFLYNSNKLNVAFSRAKSKLIIVGNIEMIKSLNLDLYPHISKMLTSQLITFV